MGLSSYQYSLFCLLCLLRTFCFYSMEEWNYITYFFCFLPLRKHNTIYPENVILRMELWLLHMLSICFSELHPYPQYLPFKFSRRMLETTHNSFHWPLKSQRNVFIYFCFWLQMLWWLHKND